MKKTSTLGIIAIIALLIALVLTLIFGGALWDVGGNGALQGLGGWLKLPMAIFTFLGDEQFYLLLVPLVYWCLNKELGADLGVLLVLSSFTNTALKSFFKHSRPFWEAPALQLGDASSFSTPSGHAQTSAALFGYLAWFLADKRRGRLWATLLGLLMVLVALSRVYLGVHFLGDILWGAAIGLSLAALYAWLKPKLLPQLKLSRSASTCSWHSSRQPSSSSSSACYWRSPSARGRCSASCTPTRTARRWRMRPRSPDWRSACGSAWRWR